MEAQPPSRNLRRGNLLGTISLTGAIVAVATLGLRGQDDHHTIPKRIPAQKTTPLNLTSEFGELFDALEATPDRFRKKSPEVLELYAKARSERRESDAVDFARALLRRVPDSELVPESRELIHLHTARSGNWLEAAAQLPFSSTVTDGSQELNALRVTSFLAVLSNDVSAAEAMLDRASQLPSLQRVRGELLDRGERLALVGRTLSPAARKELAISDMDAYVLLYFWSVFCRPCLEELPDLRRFDQILRKAGGRIAGLTLDPDLKAVEKFARDQQIPWTSMQPSQSLLEELRMTTVPCAILVRGDGVIVATDVPIRELADGWQEHILRLRPDLSGASAE
jgi:thiol-disulfide isomerase/thioredoxin